MLNFSIPCSKVTAIIGKNGSGKTTLLQCLAGLRSHQSGSLELNNKSVDSYSMFEKSQLISWCGTDLIYNFDYSAREFSSFGHYPKLNNKLSVSQKRLLRNDLQLKLIETFQFFHIEHLLDRSILELSSGEQKLISVITAISQQTPIIILDEPTAHLDLQKQIQLMNYLSELARVENKSIICVIHDTILVQRFFSYVVAMKNLDIYDHGSTHQIISCEFLSDLYDLLSCDFSKSDNNKLIIPG